MLHIPQNFLFVVEDARTIYKSLVQQILRQCNRNENLIELALLTSSEKGSMEKEHSINDYYAWSSKASLDKAETEFITY